MNKNAAVPQISPIFVFVVSMPGDRNKNAFNHKPFAAIT